MKLLVMLIILITASVAFPDQDKKNAKKENADKTAILSIIDRYAQAVNEANADSLENLFWLNDPNFSEVENCRALPFGKETFVAIADWIRENAKPEELQVFKKTDVYLLSSDVAYTVSLREEIKDKTSSRITFIMQKKNGEWRIIHGHFSYTPKE